MINRWLRHIPEQKGGGILIRNIVFDMGKVLVDYSGMPVCRHFTDNEALAKRNLHGCV